MSSNLKSMVYYSNPVFKKSADHFSQLIYSWRLLPFLGRKGGRRTFIFFFMLFLTIISTQRIYSGGLPSN